MICKECGKEVAENLEYCDSCGAPLKELAAIHISSEKMKELTKKKPRLQADGMLVDLEGYAASLVGNWTNILALLGTILVYCSTTFAWMTRDTVRDEHFTASLFDLAGKNADIAMKQPILLVYAIGILVMGIFMLIFTARENIRFLRPFADTYVLRLLPALIAIVLYVLVQNNRVYAHMLTLEGYERGIGATLCVIGLFVYCISVVLDAIRRQG